MIGSIGEGMYKFFIFILLAALDWTALPAFASDRSALPSPDTVSQDSKRKYCSISRIEDSLDRLDAAGVAKILNRNPMHQVDIFNSWEDENSIRVTNAIQHATEHYWAFPEEKNAVRLKDILEVVFDNGFMTTTTDPSDQLPYIDTLLSILYAYDVLRSNGALTQVELARYRSQIDVRYYEANLYTSKRFTLEGVSYGMKPFERRKFLDNHTAGMQYLRTLYGFLFKKPGEFSKGRKYFKLILDDTDPDDHALVMEASRGRFSWRYYTHALAQILEIVRIYDLAGENLSDYRSRVSGSDIHDVVRFFVNSTFDPTNPNLMWRYAVMDRNTGSKVNPGAADNISYKNMDTYKRVMEYNDYSHWFYIYKTMFPKNQNTLQFYKISPIKNGRATQFAKPSGYAAQCMFNTQ